MESSKVTTVASITNEQMVIASRRLLNTGDLEASMVKHGVTADTMGQLFAKYMTWINEQMDSGRTAFVAKDIMIIMNFIRDWAIHKEKLGLDEKAYNNILSMGNSAIRDVAMQSVNQVQQNRINSDIRAKPTTGSAGA